jgi:hypothetical protein
MANGPQNLEVLTFFQKPVARGLAFAIFRPPFPEERGANKQTINRQLFFVWLNNEFAFGLRPLTTGS